MLPHGPYDPADPGAPDVSMVSRDALWSPWQTPGGWPESLKQSLQITVLLMRNAPALLMDLTENEPLALGHELPTTDWVLSDLLDYIIRHAQKHFITEWKWYVRADPRETIKSRVLTAPAPITHSSAALPACLPSFSVRFLWRAPCEQVTAEE